MSARNTAHALRGIANKLREGLNNEGYDLEEVARRVLLPNDEQTEYEQERTLERLDDVAKAISELSVDLQMLRYDVQRYTEPKPAPAALEQAPAPDIPEISDIPF